MSLILIIGNATLDIVNTVPHYPAEDEELRATAQRIALGGNAVNTAIILVQHRHQCEWVGVLADDPDGQRIRQMLQDDYKVNLRYAYLEAGHSPISYITHNQQTGSRTIVHYRDLPELPLECFTRIPIDRYDWLHFEGRNIAVLKQALRYCHNNLVDQTLSLEVEKAREGIESLFPLVQVLLFSRTYAQAKGYNRPEECLGAVQRDYPEHILTCTWGAEGAWLAYQGRIQHFAPRIIKVVDSVGAGDAFNAGMIHILSTGGTPQEAIQYAMRLSERKIQQQGVLGLAGE